MATDPLDLALYGRLRAAGMPHTEAIAAAKKATGAPPKPPPVIRAPTDRERAETRMWDAIEGLPEVPAPGGLLRPSTIRAATPTERAADTVRDLYGALAAGVGRLTDPLGLSDFAGVERRATDPAAKFDVQMGMSGPPEGKALAGLVKGAPRGGFYSRVDDAVRLLPAKGAHPNKVASLLKSNASAEELAYRQVPEFLAGKGNATVTPGELQAHLAAHPAPVPTVKTLGHAPQSLNDQQNALQQRTAAAFDRAFPSATTHGQPWPEVSPGVRLGALEDMNARHWAWQAAAGDADAMAKLNRLPISPEHRAAILEYGQLANETRALNEQRLSAHPAPKYAQYQLPGGEQYRETLVTLPATGLPAGWRTGPSTTHPDRIGVFNAAGDQVTNGATAEAAIAQAKAYRADSGGFRSGHFDEPNLVVHTRANERTLPTGERGRFLEEVQSDWHQQGKKEGYARSLPPMTAQDVEVRHVPNEAFPRDAYWETYDRRTGDLIARHPGMHTEERALQDAVELGPRRQGGVPDAPFKETWPDLGLKQQLLETAADPQASWIGFTSGQTQAARYDLSKQISRVSYEPHDPGDYSLGTLYAYDHEGNQVIGQRRIAPSDLDEYIGKEPADNLRREIASHEHEAAQWSITRDPEDGMYYVLDPNGEYVGEGMGSRAGAERELADMRLGANQWETPQDPTISGLDLQVGGEGMRHFYDQVLPKRLEKILKPFGGTVERGAVPAGVSEAHHGTRALGEAFFDAAQPGSLISGKLPVGPHRTLYSREDLGEAFVSGRLNAFDMPNDLQDVVQRVGGVKEPAWIARLTPEMKARILKDGLPLLTLPLAALLGAAAAPAAPRDPEAR